MHMSPLVQLTPCARALHRFIRTFTFMKQSESSCPLGLPEKRFLFCPLGCWPQVITYLGSGQGKGRNILFYLWTWWVSILLQYSH